MCNQICSHSFFSELPEHITLKRFGHTVANYIPCGTPAYWHFTIINPISDREIPSANVICPFSAWGLPIIIQKNETIVFLVQAIIFSTLALCRNEISGPADSWHEVINAHNFCLCGNFHVELLFVELTIGNTRTKDKPPPECPCVLRWTEKMHPPTISKFHFHSHWESLKYCTCIWCIA